MSERDPTPAPPPHDEDHPPRRVETEDALRPRDVRSADVRRAVPRQGLRLQREVAAYRQAAHDDLVVRDAAPLLRDLLYRLRRKVHLVDVLVEPMAVTGPETFAMMAGGRAAMTDENRDEATRNNTRRETPGPIKNRRRRTKGTREGKRKIKTNTHTHPALYSLGNDREERYVPPDLLRYPPDRQERDVIHRGMHAHDHVDVHRLHLLPY